MLLVFLAVFVPLFFKRPLIEFKIMIKWN